MDKKTIQTFMDLDVWKIGHSVVLDIYLIVKIFPKDEIFVLSSQMRRCAISITSNIAEGFSRQSYKEKIQFYSIALGSTTELQNQLIVGKDIGIVSKEKYQQVSERLIRIHKMLNALVKSTKERSLSRYS